MFFLYATKGFEDAKERFFLGSGLNFEEAKAACTEAVTKLGYDMSYLKTFGADVVFVRESKAALDRPRPHCYEPIPCTTVNPDPTKH